jgi:hypothetical protein
MNCPLKPSQSKWCSDTGCYEGPDRECDKESCAWWNENIGQCSIAVLAQAASMIEGQVRGTW